MRRSQQNLKYKTHTEIQTKPIGIPSFQIFLALIFHDSIAELTAASVDTLSRHDSMITAIIWVPSYWYKTIYNDWSGIDNDRRTADGIKTIESSPLVSSTWKIPNSLQLCKENESKFELSLTNQNDKCSLGGRRMPEQQMTLFVSVGSDT